MAAMTHKAGVYPTKAAMAPKYLRHRSYLQLPAAAGVLVIFCSQKTGLKYLYHGQQDDILKEATIRAEALKYECDGTLMYYICDDRRNMQAAWQEAEELAGADTRV